MKTVSPKESIDKKWHREPYVWLLIVFPAVAVIGGLTTVWLAVRSNDGLVVDDYYIKGLEINQDLQRDENADEQNIKVVLDIDHTENKMVIDISGNEIFIPPESIKVSFIHATRKGFDQTYLVSVNKEGLYTIMINDLARGKWNILLEADNWRKNLVYRY